MKKFFVLVMVLGLLSGCAHVISRNVLKEVDKRIVFADLLRDPTAYKGKVVLVGGVIVDTVNKEEGTLLEIYDTALDYEGKPIHTDRSEGRFLALYQGFLDNAIYQKGRKVTIAGTVQGEKIQQLGETKYHYPYLIVKEIHLWKKEKPVYYDQYDLYPWGPWYDPWYPWGWGWYSRGYYPRYHHHWHH
jgi:outer membrane lipoprotein